MRFFPVIFIFSLTLCCAMLWCYMCLFYIRFGVRYYHHHDFLWVCVCTLLIMPGNPKAYVHMSRTRFRSLSLVNQQWLVTCRGREWHTALTHKLKHMANELRHTHSVYMSLENICSWCWFLDFIWPIAGRATMLLTFYEVFSFLFSTILYTFAHFFFRPRLHFRVCASSLLEV